MYLLVVFVIVSTSYQFYRVSKSKKISDKLVSLVTSGEYDKCYEYATSAEAQKYIPSFNLTLLCMNTAIIQNDYNKVISYFDKFDPESLNIDQKKAVYMRGLQYFITNSDSKRCKVCYENLTDIPMDDGTKSYLDRINSILILKKTDLLDTLLEENKSVTEDEQFANEFLIAEIYKNLNNFEKEKEYRNLAKLHMERFINSTSK